MERNKIDRNVEDEHFDATTKVKLLYRYEAVEDTETPVDGRIPPPPPPPVPPTFPIWKITVTSSDEVVKLSDTDAANAEDGLMEKVNFTLIYVVIFSPFFLQLTVIQICQMALIPMIIISFGC